MIKATGNDLDSSVDGVADNIRLYLPCAEADRWDPCAGVQDEGPGHLWSKAGEEEYGR